MQAAELWVPGGESCVAAVGQPSRELRSECQRTDQSGPLRERNYCSFLF